MSQWAFLFRQDRCTGCGACVAACKAWNSPRRGDRDLHPADRRGACLPSMVLRDDGAGTMQEDWRRLYTVETGTCPTDMRRAHLTVSCMHCSVPACVPACPVGRLEKEESIGAVRVRETVSCLSCGRCLEVCPWDAPQFWKPWGRRGGEIPAPMTKCDFCCEWVRAGRKTACAAACPMRALEAGPEEELLERFPQARRDFAPLPAGEGLEPHFWIVNDRDTAERRKRNG